MMYAALIEQADEGSRHKAHAALTAFHDFAVAHVEAPRLTDDHLGRRERRAASEGGPAVGA